MLGEYGKVRADENKGGASGGAPSSSEEAAVSGLDIDEGRETRERERKGASSSAEVRNKSSEDRR